MLYVMVAGVTTAEFEEALDEAVRRIQRNPDVNTFFFVNEDRVVELEVYDSLRNVTYKGAEAMSKLVDLKMGVANGS